MIMLEDLISSVEASLAEFLEPGSLPAETFDDLKTENALKYVSRSLKVGQMRKRYERLCKGTKI